jgi:membrane-bound metal-dependent hydrolase YbcI (DUF457 family)
MSIAYLLGKGSSKLLHVKINIPLIMVLSLIPDIDIIFNIFSPTNLHRGPTHSVVVAFLAFIPFFIIYRKRAIPYFLALISHSLIGDFIIGGQLMLFWPFTNAQFGLHELGGPYISIYMPIDGVIELVLFAAAIAVLVKSNDWKVFFSSAKSNLLLIIPILTVLLPTTVGYPFSESLFQFQPALAVAHVIYLVLFSIAVIKTLTAMYKQRFPPSKKPPDATEKQPTNSAKS